MTTRSLKLILATLVFMGTMLPATLSIAADNENTTTSNTTKNPLTGTVTTTKKHHRKMKHANGKVSEKTTEDKTSVKPNGATESSSSETNTPAK